MSLDEDEFSGPISSFGSNQLGDSNKVGRRLNSRSQDGKKRPTRSIVGPKKVQVIGGLALSCALLLSTLQTRCLCQSIDSNNPITTSRPQTSNDEQPNNSANASTASLSEPAQSGSAATINGASPAASKLKPINFTLVDELFEATLEDSDLQLRWKNMDGQFQEGIRSILKMVFPQIVAISQDAKVSGDCSGGILKWILSLRNLRSWAIKMLDATGKPTSGIFEGSLTMFGNYRQCLSVRAPDEDEIEISDQFEEYFRGRYCVLHLRPWLGAKRPFYSLNSTVESLLRTNYKYYEKSLYDELAEIAVAFNFIDIRMDLCVPSTCTVADIQRVADLLSRKLEMRAKVMRCDIESREPTTASFVSNFDQTTLSWLTVPVTLIALTTIATLFNLFKPCRESEFRLARLCHCLSIQGSFANLLRKQSAPFASTMLAHQNRNHNNSNNYQNHEHANLEPATMRRQQMYKPTQLYAMRNLLTIWFVIVQLTVQLDYQYLRESLVLRNMMLTYWPLQIIINTSMIFESLILITAFTFSYSNLDSKMVNLIVYIAHKYVRLVPSIITLILFTIITPTIGLSSPVWKNFVDEQSQVCKSTGYLDLFFLQNMISYNKICLPHSWLFCVEMQLIILTMPIVLLLKRTFVHNEDSIILNSQNVDDLAKPSTKKVAGNISYNLKATFFHLLFKSKAGLIGLVLVIVGASANFTLVYTNQLPPAWFNTFPDVEQKSYYFGKYMTKAWTHLSAFVIGLYAGYLSRATFKLLPVNRHINSSGQTNDNTSNDDCAGSSIVSDRVQDNKRSSNCYIDHIFKLSAIACLFSIIFCTFNWSTAELPTPLIAALYDTLSRLIWSFTLAGLIIKICIPNQPQVSKDEASSLFTNHLCLVLGRLSFLAYLIGPYVHTLIFALQEQSLFPSLYLIFHVILGNTVITYFVAFILSILIEQPIRLAFEELFWRFLKNKHTSSQQQYDRSSVDCLPIASNGTTSTSATSLSS